MSVSGSCLLVSGGGHSGHSLHALASILVHAAPGPETRTSKEEPGGGTKGEMQREPCQRYLLKIIKLRESSLFLASFYLLLKRVMSKCAKNVAPTPAPLAAGSSGAKGDAKGVPLQQEGASLGRTEPPCCPGSAGGGGEWGPPPACAHTCLPCTSRPPRMGTSASTLHLGLAALAGAGNTATPCGPPGWRSGAFWPFSGTIYRCLTPAGAALGTSRPPPAGLDGRLRRCLRPPALLGFTLTPSSLFLDEAKYWDCRGNRHPETVLGCRRGVYMRPLLPLQCVGPVTAEQSGLCLPSVGGKPLCV